MTRIEIQEMIEQSVGFRLREEIGNILARKRLNNRLRFRFLGTFGTRKAIARIRITAEKAGAHAATFQYTIFIYVPTPTLSVSSMKLSISPCASRASRQSATN